MTIRTNTPNLLDNPPIPVQAKLAAAWTSFMFLYVYVDILAFYKPGVVDDILVGVVWEFDITQTWAITALTLLAIPIFMVVLSMTLPARPTASRTSSWPRYRSPSRHSTRWARWASPGCTSTSLASHWK